MLFHPLKRLLTKSQKKRAFFILCLMLCGMGLEVFGIGLILPVSSMMLNEGEVFFSLLQNYMPGDLLELQSKVFFY